MGNGNLTKNVFTEAAEQLANLMNDEDKNNIEAGNYPIIISIDGDFVKQYIKEEEIENYSNFDNTFEEKLALWERFGNAVPIVE